MPLSGGRLNFAHERRQVARRGIPRHWRATRWRYRDSVSRSRQEREHIGVRRTDHREVAAVERGNLDSAQPLRDRHDGRVSRAQGQIGVGPHE